MTEITPAWARAQMPRVVRAVSHLPDMSGVRLAMSMHLDMKMLPLVEGLAGRGAALFITTCNPATVRNEVVDAMRAAGARVDAFKDMPEDDWQRAIEALTAYVRREPKSADAFNYLGYAQRNLGNYDAAFAAYGQALKIDPDHKGAHEYVGEAYLQTGNLAKAEEHLSKLDELCLFGCAEYTALKEAVAAYKAKNS